MDEEVIEKYKKAGIIAKEAIELGKTLIKPGVFVSEVTDKIESFITEKVEKINGSFPALAFPTQMSINDAAAHQYVALNDKTIFNENDIIKLDLGVSVDGYIADTAVTIDLGDHKDIVNASKKALENAIKVLRQGVELWEIGKTIEETMADFGVNPIKNLSGHGLDRFMVHTSPSIPNFNNNDKTKISNRAIAIEPFSTKGVGFVKEKGDAEVFMLVNKKPVRNMITRKILNEILRYNGLAFAKRWIEKKFGEAKTRLAFMELERFGIIRGYPKLVERSNQDVAQFEHTILLLDKPFVTTL